LREVGGCPFTHTPRDNRRRGRVKRADPSRRTLGEFLRDSPDEPGLPEALVEL
jgi:hypothetical protein